MLCRRSAVCAGICSRSPALPSGSIFQRTRRPSLRLSQAGTSNGGSPFASTPTAQSPSLAPVMSTPEPAAAVPECSPGPATFQKLAALGAAKGSMTFTRTFVLGIIGGCFIAFGSLFGLSIGAALPGIMQSDPGLQRLLLGLFGLPLGLILVLVLGMELFTGNTMVMTIAVLQGLATPGQLAKSWTASYAGNLAGSLFIVWLLGQTGLTIQHQAAGAVAIQKTTLTFVEAFSRAIIANWLVNLGVWMVTAASSLPGKFCGAIYPVTAFTAMMMEHSIANMSLILIGMGASGCTWHSYWIGNLLPVTLGNIVGGGLCMGVAMSWAFGKQKIA